VATIAFFVRSFVQRATGLTRPTLLDDDGLGPGAICSKYEMPRGGATGLLNERRRASITEERVGRTVTRIRESAKSITRAQEDARGTAMSAKQGGLV
jgi:hypothetical protein